MNKTTYDKLAKELIGTKVPKPLFGTLSGHAAGEPFDKPVYTILKKWFPDKTFRQYEYLNFLFSNNLSVTDSLMNKIQYHSDMNFPITLV